MNLSTISIPTGAKPECSAPVTESPVSSGNRATVDPILGITSRGDALDVLDARDDLTAAQKRHLNRVVLSEHRVVLEGTDKQNPVLYLRRKAHDLTWEKLVRGISRAERRLREMGRVLAKLAPSSSYRDPLLREIRHWSAKLNALRDEAAQRQSHGRS